MKKVLLEGKRNYKLPKIQLTSNSRSKARSRLLRQARTSQLNLHLKKLVAFSRIFSESEEKKRSQRKKKSQQMLRILFRLRRKIRKRRETLMFCLE